MRRATAHSSRFHQENDRLCRHGFARADGTETLERVGFDADGVDVDCQESGDVLAHLVLEGAELRLFEVTAFRAASTNTRLSASLYRSSVFG